MKNNKYYICLLVSIVIAFTTITVCFASNKNDKYVKQVASLIKHGQTTEALKMIKTVPNESKQNLGDWIIKNEPNLEPLYLIVFAESIFYNNKNDASFLFLLGKYRTYYDAARCKDTSSCSGISFIAMIAPKTAQYIASNQDILITYTPKVIDFEKKHPAKTSPKWICAHGINNFIKGADAGIVEESKWPSIKESISKSLIDGVETLKKEQEQTKKFADAKIIQEYGNLNSNYYKGKAFLVLDNKVLYTDRPSRLELFDIETKKAEKLSIPFSYNKDYESLTVLSKKLILIAGGMAHKDYSKETFFINLENKEINPAGKLNHHRSWHTATLLKDGSILLAGGRTGLFTPESKQAGEYEERTAQAEVYNPNTKKSIDVGKMNFPRFNHSALLLQSGKVLIVGGEKATTEIVDTKNIEIYDPQKKTFSVIGKMHNDMQKTPRLTLLKDGKVLAIGGNAKAELIDPISGIVEQLPDTKNAIRSEGDSSVLLSDGKVFIVGPEGYGKGKTCLELYNPETKIFELIAEIAPQRLTTNSILLENDSVLIVGGDDLKKSILIFNYSNYKKVFN